MIKKNNVFFSTVGVMTICFAGMAAVFQADYLESGVVSICAGAIAGLFNLLSLREEKNSGN